MEIKFVEEMLLRNVQFVQPNKNNECFQKYFICVVSFKEYIKSNQGRVIYFPIEARAKDLINSEVKKSNTIRHVENYLEIFQKFGHTINIIQT